MSDRINVFICIMLLILICVGVLGGAFAFKQARCHAQAVSFDEHYYAIHSGCMVKHEGRWLPLENIRGFD